MPTALPLPLREVDVPLQYSERHSTVFNRDAAVVAAFTATGLALTFLLTMLFPLAGNVAALALSVT